MEYLQVAVEVANLIMYLTEYGLIVENLLVVGHSLGCHIAGLAGRQLIFGMIGVIIALDPAGVLYPLNQIQNRISKFDAIYVQVIHTDGNHFSILEPLGHADFYPNGGKHMPGCPRPRYHRILGSTDIHDFLKHYTM